MFPVGSNWDESEALSLSWFPSPDALEAKRRSMIFQFRYTRRTVRSNSQQCLKVPLLKSLLVSMSYEVKSHRASYQVTTLRRQVGEHSTYDSTHHFGGSGEQE
jgi:hypothetical protein